MAHLPIRPLSRRTFATSLAAVALGSGPLRAMARQEQRQYTFLGLGLDKYSETGQRSDVIMLARVDLDAGTVRVLSIPRDLYVDIPGYPAFKINDAYNDGLHSTPEKDWRNGAALTAETIRQNFGITVDGVALTDFTVFPKVVDTLGGVTVENPHAVGDFPAGTLHLDGDQATLFCRLRPDGDGGRVMRQHLVLVAMLKTLQTPAFLPRIPELVQTLSDVVHTTIPVEVQAQLIALIPQLTEEDLAFTNIEGLLWSGYTDGGAWIYQGDWSVLPGYVQGWLAGEIE